ncbi:hypothetical protein K523DRAFT_400899 [Schizophyllum commune Tattone D]|nr:hypothetical protein K523DRAFT_400899 [Schizophyllum commune Tattone D]
MFSLLSLNAPLAAPALPTSSATASIDSQGDDAATRGSSFVGAGSFPGATLGFGDVNLTASCTCGLASAGGFQSAPNLADADLGRRREASIRPDRQRWTVLRLCPPCVRVLNAGTLHEDFEMKSMDLPVCCTAALPVSREVSVPAIAHLRPSAGGAADPSGASGVAMRGYIASAACALYKVCEGFHPARTHAKYGLSSATYVARQQAQQLSVTGVKQAF